MYTARFWKDASERLLAAFLEGAVSGLVITNVTDTSMWLAVLAGGVSSAASVLKSIVAGRVGYSDSASLNRNV
jgi:hypothetical protein